MVGMSKDHVMKIAIIAFELPSAKERTGGVGHFNHRLSNMLVERGYDITAYTVQKEVSEAHYRLAEIPGKRKSGRFNRYYIAPLQARQIDFSQYDLVISNGDDWAMKRKGTTWIRIMHGSAWRELQHNKRLVRKLNLSFLYFLELLSSTCSTINLFNSQDTKILYPRRKNDKIVHLPVDTRQFYPGKKSDEPTIMFVGGLDSRKRGRWLLELFVNHIRPKIPNARLCMVCDPGDSYAGVEYIQHASLEILAGLYRSAHVFCMPSTYEGFGIPYLEAMASGTLVVTTPNPGAKELLQDGKYGWIVDDSALAASLTNALTSLDSHTAWTEPALNWARQHDWTIMLPEFLVQGASGKQQDINEGTR